MFGMIGGIMGRSVALLHDQLQDARIWAELKPLVSAYARVVSFSAPQLHVLDPSPVAWSGHVARHAREAIGAGGVDLVVTIGGAAGGGVELVADRLARTALLIDPDLTPLANDAVREVLHDRDVGERLARFFQRLNPHLEELVTHGTMSEEGIDALVAASFQDDSDLPSQHQELLRNMLAEQLRATLPLDLAAQRTGVPSGPDWIALLGPVARQCTVATSPPDPRLGRLIDLGAELGRRAPGVAVVTITHSRAHLLSHSSEELAALIRDIGEANRRQ
jgi:hypothetical protein